MTHQVSTPGNGASDVAIVDLRFEHQRHAVGVGESCPRLSWVVATGVEGWRQAAYEVEAYSSDGQLCDQTGRVESNQSVLVPWPLTPLASRECLTVRVRVWDADGHLSAWRSSTPEWLR